MADEVFLSIEDWRGLLDIYPELNKIELPLLSEGKLVFSGKSKQKLIDLVDFGSDGKPAHSLISNRRGTYYPEKSIYIDFTTEDLTAFQIAERALQSPLVSRYNIAFSTGDSAWFTERDLRSLFDFSVAYAADSGVVELVDYYQALNTLTKAQLKNGHDRYPAIGLVDTKRKLVEESNHAHLFSSSDKSNESNLVDKIIGVRAEYGEFIKS